MSAEVITICDAQFFELCKVCLMSYRHIGDVNVPMAVYDFGLNKDNHDWCEHKEIEVRPLDFVPRKLLPVNRSGRQRTFDLWICKTWAIGNAAARLKGDNVLCFIDSDMAATTSVWSDMLSVIKDPRSHRNNPRDCVAVVRDVMEFRHYANISRSEWAEWFPDVDSIGPDSPSWNIGLLLGEKTAFDAIYDDWQILNCRYATEEQFAKTFTVNCLDQLMFSILCLRQGVIDIPREYNVTRPMWNSTELAAKAKAIHLTGPIKPWEPGGAIHPMTILWGAVRNALHTEGLLE